MATTTAASAGATGVETAPANPAPVPAAPKKGDANRLFSSSLVSAWTWDYFAPPPSNSFKGKVIPHFLNKFSKRRKLSIEVHKITPAAALNKKDGKDYSYEECVVRVLVNSDKHASKEIRKEALDKRRKSAQAGSLAADAAAASIMDESIVDDASIAGIPELEDDGGKHFEGWVPRYKIPCTDITVKHQHNQSVFVLVQIQKQKQERELIFDSFGEAQDFVKTLESQKKREEQRQKKRAEAHLSGRDLPKGEKVTLLIEIVSAWDIPVGDFTTSDPYVVCLLGRKEVHKTDVVFNTLDPIWTIKTGSLFLVEIESEALFMSEGLTLVMKDFDRLGRNEVLAVATVPPEDIYDGHSERKEYKLLPPPGSKDQEVPGYIAVRSRRASQYDIEFMQNYESSKKAASAPEHPKSTTSDIKSILTRREKRDKDGVTRYKMRPGPDPNREDETTWMTHEEIQTECMKESEHWIDAGSGKLGRLHVEILGCDGLPNLDTGGMLGNKTDAFVSLVYEDCYVRTDTIDDCLSPRWMPWTRRAFCFNIAHPSSQLLLGVFDFDAGFDDHDLIGRISVDVTNLIEDTEYILSYNIYPSARISGREVQGQITIRLRIDLDDERKLILSTLEPPPPVYVNVKKRKDFRVVRATCMGKTDYEKYSVKTIKSYLDELREYQQVLFYLEDGVMALLLWRGHFPIKIGSTTYNFPMHSFNAFITATLLVEHPQLFPSFVFACIAWLLLAVMGHRRNSANLWSRCKSFDQILHALILGDTKTAPPKIEPFQDYDKAKNELEEWLRRIEEAEKKAEKSFQEAQKLEAERLKELEEIGDADADISTKVGSGGVTIDPIKAALFPVQLLLGVICRKIRFVRNIITWEESYFAFWITTGCILLSVASVFVPWFWILKWSSRFIVWTLFGPWMKLLDIYYFSAIEPESEEEVKRKEQQGKLKRRLAATEAASRARIIRENAAKMKVMKKHMFGKFGMKIPILKEDRYSDRPLPQSSATPYQTKNLSLAELAMHDAGYHRTRLPGQNLVGDMIPMVENETFTAAPTGKATANPKLLDKAAPGGGKAKGSDSTTVAYAKIAMAIVISGGVTWVFVPVLAAFVAQLFENV